MVVEKITRPDNCSRGGNIYMRNFKCEYCSNKVRTDDIGCPGLGLGPVMWKMQAVCPVCGHLNDIPYYQQSDDRIEGEEYISYEDYMAENGTEKIAD